MHPMGVLGVDEEVFQKVMIAGIVLVIIAVFLLFKTIGMTNQVLSEGMQCNEVVDKIYEQCREESMINITTLEGRDTVLKYENGVCIIK